MRGAAGRAGDRLEELGAIVGIAEAVLHVKMVDGFHVLGVEYLEIEGSDGGSRGGRELEGQDVANQEEIRGHCTGECDQF